MIIYFLRPILLNIDNERHDYNLKLLHYLNFEILNYTYNILYLIYYIKFVPEIEVPFDKATIEELQQKPEKVQSSSFEYKEDKGEEED